MKKLIIFLCILGLTGAIVFFVKNQNEKENNVLPAAVVNTSPKPTLPPVLPQSAVIDFKGTPIRVSWATAEPQQVELYSNLKDQHLSEQIKVDKSCSILVNGGFYSKENTHLGLFATDSETIYKAIQNPTLNGFLSIDNDNILIGSNQPSNTARIAIQSGPLLFQDNEPMLLAINNDKTSRRIVAATIKADVLIFLAFYRDSSDLDGPLLGDLPEIIELFEKQTNIDIVNAINLDGGSASVFVTNYVILRELAHIGSYFCIK